MPHSPSAPTETDLAYGAALIAVFDHVDDVFVFVKDRQRRFVACSEPFARLLGYRLARQVLGLRDEELSPEYLADHYRGHDEHILETGEQLIDLVELVRNVDGSYDWFLTTKTAILAGGTVVGLVGLTRRLTKRHVGSEKLLSLTPAVELISRNYSNPLTVAEMAATVSMSASHFTRNFKAHFGCTPYQYLRRVRTMAACDLLSTTDLPLLTIAAKTGHYDQSHFSKDFRRDRGIAPAEYRRRHQGVSSQHVSRIAMGQPG